MDRAFENEMKVLINTTDVAFSQMMWREGLHSGFFSMQLLRDSYRDWCTKTGTPVHKELILRFIRAQTIMLAPICPHFSEHIWALLGETGSVLKTRWPEAGGVDGWMSRSFQFLTKTLRSFRLSLVKVRAR
ncbi:unnamed protein product [Discosporangium mesarthrocarpum]